MAGRAGSGAGMVEGGRWHKWVFFYVPLTLFVVGTLFPFYWMLVTAFRPDGELYRPWRAVNNTPFWTTQPTLEHAIYLFKQTMFATWLWNTMFIAVLSTLISLFCGLLAGYALARLRFPLAGGLGTGIFVTYLVPPTLLFIPLADIIREFRLGDTPWSLILTYPTFLIPFCTWLLMGYFKTIPKELEECARIDGASRLRAMVQIIFPIATPGILSAGIFAFTLSWNEHLRARLSLLPAAEDGAGRRRLRADPGRCLLLGTAHGRGAAGIDPGRPHLFVLRRALCRRPHRGRERLRHVVGEIVYDRAF
jgi:multiple sugar transport system permease protein